VGFCSFDTILYRANQGEARGLLEKYQRALQDPLALNPGW